jgi:DNA replication ATP-dependent helicase Dna2
VLVVEESQTANVRKILLRQSWFDTPATIGSYVHVTGTFNSAGDCIIDNASNILILHPDHLISATVVADSFGCIRRAVLQDRVKATGEASPPMMYGHILHELFQEAMKANQWDNASLKQLMDAILPRHYETMVEIGLNLNQVHEHLKSKFQEMQSWAELFVRASPTREAVIKGRNGQQAIMCINKLLDVEEHIWSPKYGLKGNVDATVQATIRDGSSSRVLTLPFELKTGKRMNEQHVAQTALYTLLTSDRYGMYIMIRIKGSMTNMKLDVEITEGVLYYLENSHTTRVQAIRHELIHLVMKRNELACYVRERLKLPPMLPESRQRMCNNCYAQTTCFLHHKLAEAGTSDTLMNKGRFEELVKYLKPLDQIFFMKWDQLLTKEESEMKKFTRELWTMPSKERETRGRCFSGVVIEPGSAHELAAASKINRFQYTFVKQITILGFSFTESQITVGEPIVVSDEKGHYALANGYVTHVHKKRITVAVDRRLHNARTRRPGFNSQTNQDFIGVMEALATQDDQDTEPVVYRLDKDEFSNGMATARNNLLQIMDDTIYKAADLRAMVVQDRAPRFKAPSGTMGLQSQNWQAEMNSDQKAAVEKVMAAQDYALVLGMPGTGKTTTIAQIIRALVAQGKSVLLTSYTHTAVDNILLKVRDAGFDVLRLGVLAKVHPQVQEFAILAAQQKDSLEEVQDAWCKPPVVATTCLGVNHPIFGKRTFDYCIVDEASQITLPVCLGPIRMAKTFVLVGDHFQLPPLVQNKEAQEGGLDMSLFRLLSERHLDAVVSLEHQYRMCADIMHLSNTLIYDGRLKCGTETVATQALLPPHPGKSLKTHHFPDSRLPSNNCQPCSGPSSPSCHISLALQPENKVLFLNTDTLHPLSTEILSGPRITNPLEAALTSQLVVALLDAGVPASEVGVITFYRSQLAELRQMLRGQPGLELHTADRFQGRDKEAVVVSFVRNNADRNVGELLRDWRRINVAVTRAKSKLILVGSKSTLSNGGEVLKGLVDVCEKNGWMHDLKSGEHTFPELGATQFSGKTQQHSPGKKALRNSSRKHAPPPSVNVQGRKPLTEIGGGQLNRKTLKMPEKRGKINEKGLIGSRPVLRDIMHDIFGDEMEN